MPRYIGRMDEIRCALCYDPPCTAACEKQDPGALLRSVWFRNAAGAAARTPEGGLCAGCGAPCEKACPRGVPIRGALMRLEELRRYAIPTVPEDEEMLKCDFCGTELENPFLLSSSVVASTFDMCDRALAAGWAGVCFKTISMMEMHEASPRYSAIYGDSGSIIGFKNIEQLSDHSLIENMKVFRQLKEKWPRKFLLASIMGRNDNEWSYLARMMEEAGADGIELNFSCPNMVEEGTGSDIGQVPELVERFTRAARKGSRLPLLAKLTPNVASMVPMARAALRGGADGIAAINTIRSLIEVNGNMRKAAVGGFSGNSVRPVAMRFLAELGQMPEMKDKHLSGMGGVETWEDAGEFIALGCGSVQITTAVMQYGYRIIDDLKDGLIRYLKLADMTLGELKGSFLNRVVDVEEIERDTVVYPRFDREHCVSCGRCYISCMDGGHQAIAFGEDRRPVLKPDRCVGCHLCVLVCPTGAVVSSEKRVKKENQANSQSGIG